MYSYPSSAIYTSRLIPIHSYHHPLLAYSLQISNPLRKSIISDLRFRRTSSNLRLSVSGFKQQDLHKKSAMTITETVRISDRKILVKNRTILTNLPENVISKSGSSYGPVEGLFIGAVFDEEKSKHVVSLGTLNDVRFMSCFRFKLWWMAQKMGRTGRDVPLETQFLLIESDGGDASDQIMYTVFLPLIEGSFRACLQGNQNDELEMCLESGDVATKASLFGHSVFIGSGTDPYTTISNSIRTVKNHLNTFRQRHEKKLPEIVDYFGWCTWDAFYQDVTQEDVESGLESLIKGGLAPKFVIIDDGWQSVEGDPHHNPTDCHNQTPLNRLTNIKENKKFQCNDNPTAGIKSIVDIVKQKHGVKHVYVWHAITGYWGGVRPGTSGYNSSMRYPILSKGVVENEPGWKEDPLAVQGLGLVSPKNVGKFYGEMHEYLASAGVDGVKVDVQCILETLGDGLGGRVELTRQYHKALDASVARNFPDNGCIACMSHNTDALYCSKQTGVIRASDDFYPRDPVSHTIHIASVSYNSVFLGEFMQPDWDMFHSSHPAAEYHASARAISGGPVYVSDAPGNHNFDILRKLVLPDGSVLRALLPGRPTVDCLFTDPARDGLSLLKIWNLNKYTGVLGVYNCQGAAWCSTKRKNSFHKTGSDALTGAIRGSDIHFIADLATDKSVWNGDSAVYCHSSKKLIALPQNASLPVSLKVLEHEVFTITPIKSMAPGLGFAPLGLIDMYNAGGAVQGLRYEVEDGAVVHMEVKGCGRFGCYSSAKPRMCIVGSNEVHFGYDSLSGLISFNIDYMPGEGQKAHVVTIEL